jgi:hypothetical protein
VNLREPAVGRENQNPLRRLPERERNLPVRRPYLGDDEVPGADELVLEILSCSAKVRAASAAWIGFMMFSLWCCPCITYLKEGTMETLKPLNKILEPDGRNRYRNITLPALHAIAADITLHPSVPEPVQDQFTIARNAYLYSWFFYPFQAPALLYSILSIELALQIRVKEANPDMFSGDREPTLFPLLRYALQKRWIVDSGFDIEVMADFQTTEKIAKQFPNIPVDQRYSYNLLDVLPMLRNDLAHGNYMLAPGMGPLLMRGAELINQLFPKAAL